MSDSYQAIYDAARSKLPYCDTHSAIGEAARQALDASHAIHTVQIEFCHAANSMQRPSVLFRPTLTV